MSDSCFLTRQQFAKRLGVSVATFDRMRLSGEIGPLPVTVRRRPRWSTREAEAWLSRRDRRGQLYRVDLWPRVWQSIQA